MSYTRLDKLIASQGNMTRKEVQKLIKSGMVEVNGELVTDCGLSVDSDTDRVKIDGNELFYKRSIYIMMNKPAGVLSASSDKKATTVIDLVPDKLRRRELFPAGRLDKDTTGFILITDDGALSHNILSPKNHVIKTYEALLNAEISERDISLFAEGIVLEDGTECMPAQIKALGNCIVQIKICEGKFHQIKRMVAAVGKEVLQLKRVSIGGLELDTSLAEGECREITEDELNSLLMI